MGNGTKVGVLTHCVADNYGANLQALSTGSYLRNAGYEPFFLKWTPYPTNANREQVLIHNTFLERQGFTVSENCESDEDFVNCINRYDLHNIIVGSDCIFTFTPSPIIPYRLTRHGISKVTILKDWRFPNPFWLPFYNKVKIKAFIMSGSCGGSDLNKASNIVKKEMGELLKNFDYISVRDDYTRESLKSIIGNEKAESLSITPDPVFSFNQNVTSILDKKNLLSKYNLPDNYITIGFYHETSPTVEWLMTLKKVANDRGMSVVNLPMPQANRYMIANVNIPLPLDPLDWYYLIAYSKGYIGNNMHPIIVCIHNNVPFYSVNAHGKFSRIRRRQDYLHTKEFELLKRFNMLNYHTPISEIYSVNPSDVVDKLVNFNSDNCKKASITLLNEYNTMMAEIVSILT